jgi:tRNA-2-methylthio-N6-dimethylallyladenosine synthase
MDHNGKLFIETVGCQMNVLDSELVVAALRKSGYELTGDPKEADTVLFNTCSVREHAEQKIYSAVGRLKYSKRHRPRQVIGVIGCMAQKDQDQIFRRAPHVDLVVGTGQLAEIPALIVKARETRERQLAVSLGRRDGSRHEVAGSFESYDPLRDPEMRPSPWQAYVRIMIGCDKFCTYCVVPMTRGPEQSRPPGDILREVQALADQGVKEVTLLGQTVNSYHFNQDGRTYRLSDLLELIHDTPGIVRIKFVTNFPKDMTDDLLQAVRDLPKVAHYLHVPLQAGCDDVLRRMKRGYTVADYREMHARIRETIPDCSVSSDFIVGFCGESEESFQKSVETVREYRFKNSFIFKYSPRPGTKAHELFVDDVPEEVKRRRNHELLEAQTEISAEDNAGFIGRTVNVLVEGPSKAALKAAERDELPGWHGASGANSEGAPNVSLDISPQISPVGTPLTTDHSALSAQLVGRTACDRIVVFEGNPRLAGTLAEVHVDDCTPTTLIGAIVIQERQHGSGSLLPILV